jgi:hypothetical protein
MKKHSTFNIQHSTPKSLLDSHSLNVERSMLNVECFLLHLALILLLTFSVSAQETQRLYLSGHDKDDAVPWEFQCTSGANSGFWTNIPVPSHWDMHGFGTLNYHRDLSSAFDEKGLYAKNFSVPKNWSKQRIFLVFEGVMTDTSAKLNGESVGPTHQGSFYRFKYEVTKLVKFGATNRLEVTVAKHSANASVNNAERNADYWVFGGIFRPVYLEAVPQQFIERVAIDAKADGSFRMDVFAHNPTNVSAIEMQISELNGRPVPNGTVSIMDILSTPSGQTQLQFHTTIKQPRLWTAETPNLYSVEVRLKRDKEIIHRYTQRFGFRTFEVRDGDGLYLNGQRVILKGADRHSFWPDSGRCLSEKIHRLDIETMKDMNMNAVRMSHYPPDEKFLDLCDELGLYVLDELGGWHHFYDNEVGPKLVREMVERDVNHPSILFWDNGNEGGFNTNLDHIFPELDPQHRRVLHPWAAFSGVNTAHYLDYEQAKIACEGLPLAHLPSGRLVAEASDTNKWIYMPTEFQHGLFDGGAGAGLEDYWKLMSASKYLGGGFIWALTDDAVKRPDTGEMDGAGNQAPDGIVGPYRQREGSFYAIKEIWSPIQVKRENGIEFTVENHYGFTDASQCKFTWQLRRFESPLEKKSKNQIIKEETITPPRIPPSGKATLRFPDNFNRIARSDKDSLVLLVDDPHGKRLWTWTWPFMNPPLAPAPFEGGAISPPISVENEEMYQLKSHDVTVEISRKTGFLLNVWRNGKRYSLSGGPRKGDGDNLILNLSVLNEEQQEKIFSGESRYKNVRWTLYETGWLQCDYTYTATGTNDYFGVLFDYPETLVKHKRWLGDGPYRVWKNRLRGITLGVWENDYNNTITGWRDWIYPEFKGFFSNVRWLQLDTTEGQITVVNNSGVPFMQVLTPEFPPTNLVAKTVLSVPKCGLGFLDAIPAVGSKFKDATFTGPQGQPNVGQGEYSGSVSFYFGKLP